MRLRRVRLRHVRLRHVRLRHVRLRRLLGAAAVGCLLLCAGLLHGQALEEVDRAAAELGRFVLRLVPDRRGLRVAVLPFLSDRHGRVLLGDRLRGELELYLSAELSQTRTAAESGEAGAYSVSGELQLYPAAIRLLCRVYEPDGALAGGTRVDLPATAELVALLESPSEGPSSGGLRPRVGELRPPSEGLRDAAPGQEPQGETLDPFEPDDQPGFEVEVPPESGEGSAGPALYARYLAPGDIDRFRFYMPRAGRAALEVRTGVDLQLLLFVEGENLPFEVASSRAGDSLRLEPALQEGYYIIEILAFDLNIRGRYSLSLALSGTADDGFEPDSTLEQAAVLPPGARQQRVLLPGDADWVELAFGAPGFYALYTTGDALDTSIGLYAENGREFLSDQDSGEGANAFVVTFLGVRRTFARLSAAGTDRGGPYGLVFERVEPRQLYPDGTVQTFPLGATPETLQLRIVQSGRYLIAVRAGDSSPSAARPTAPAPAVALFSLPSMRRLGPPDAEGLHDLPAGDYLLLVTDGQAGMLRLCVAPESQSEACRRRIAE